MFWWFNATVKAYWKQLSFFFWIYCCFLFFNHSGESIYMIHLFSNLFFEGDNALNQYYHKQTPFFSLVFLNVLGNFVKEIQKVFSIISSVWLPIKVSILWLLVCIVQVSSESLEEIKLICIVNWIFHSLLVL